MSVEIPVKERCIRCFITRSKCRRQHLNSKCSWPSSLFHRAMINAVDASNAGGRRTSTGGVSEIPHKTLQTIGQDIIASRPLLTTQLFDDDPSARHGCQDDQLVDVVVPIELTEVMHRAGTVKRADATCWVCGRNASILYMPCASALGCDGVAHPACLHIDIGSAAELRSSVHSTCCAFCPQHAAEKVVHAARPAALDDPECATCGGRVHEDDAITCYIAGCPTPVLHFQCLPLQLNVSSDVAGVRAFRDNTIFNCEKHAAPRFVGVPDFSASANVLDATPDGVEGGVDPMAEEYDEEPAAAQPPVRRQRSARSARPAHRAFARPTEGERPAEEEVEEGGAAPSRRRYRYRSSAAEDERPAEDEEEEGGAGPSRRRYRSSETALALAPAGGAARLEGERAEGERAEEGGAAPSRRRCRSSETALAPAAAPLDPAGGAASPARRCRSKTVPATPLTVEASHVPAAAAAAAAPLTVGPATPMELHAEPSSSAPAAPTIGPAAATTASLEAELEAMLDVDLSTLDERRRHVNEQRVAVHQSVVKECEAYKKNPVFRDMLRKAETGAVNDDILNRFVYCILVYPVLTYALPDDSLCRIRKADDTGRLLSPRILPFLTIEQLNSSTDINVDTLEALVLGTFTPTEVTIISREPLTVTLTPGTLGDSTETLQKKTLTYDSSKMTLKDFYGDILCGETLSHPMTIMSVAADVLSLLECSPHDDMLLNLSSEYDPDALREAKRQKMVHALVDCVRQDPLRLAYAQETLHHEIVLANMLTAYIGGV